MQTTRTTIELDKELLKKAKQKALEEDRPMKEVFREALAKYLSGYKTKTRKKFVLKTYPIGVKLPLTREQIYEDI